MKMTSRACLLGLTLLTLPALPGLAQTPDALLIVPSRYTLVQLGFDVAKLRPVRLIAYEVEPRTQALYLHRWDTGLMDWVRISGDDYSSGMGYRPIPPRAVLIAENDGLPERLKALPDGMDVTHIATLKIAQVVNGLHDVFAFEPSEWRWLARRHRLELKDLNAERRRWGRYGPPGIRPVPRDDRMSAPESVPVPAPAPERRPTHTFDTAPVRITPPAHEEKGVPAPAADVSVPENLPMEPEWNTGAEIAPEDK
jgi:hypothetical protein